MANIDLQESMELGTLGNYEDPVLKFLTNENGETTVEGFPFFSSVPSTNPQDWSPDHSSPWNNNTNELSLEILSGNAQEVAPSQSDLALDFTALPYDPNLQPLYESLFNTANSFGLASSSPGSSSAPSSPGTVASTPIPLLLPKEEEKSEEKANARRKRQRKNKKGDSDPVAPTAITLPRDQLLLLSSEDLDDYVARITAIRPLTTEEEKDVKRQRRLIKNRESAQMSRERKKVFVDDLRVKVNALQQENHQMSSKITELSAENRALKEEVAQLQGVINKSSFLTHLLNSMTSIKSKSKADEMSLATVSNRAKAAGVCLMIVIFSFGLLFNNTPVTAPTITREPIPQVLPSYASSQDISPNMRELLEVFPEPTTTLRRYGALQFDTEAPQPTIPTIEELPSETEPTALSNDEPQTSFARSSSIKLGSLLPPQQQPTQQDQPFNSTYVEQNVHMTDVEDIAAPAPRTGNVAKPNITYLLCNNPQVIHPPANNSANETSNIDPSAPFLIALMIPPGVLQARNQLLNLPYDPSALLEVTCQVLDINVGSVLPNPNNNPIQTVSTQA